MQVIPLTKDWELLRDENDTLYLAHKSEEVNTMIEIGTYTIQNHQLSLEEAVNLLRSNGLTTSKPN